MYHDQGLPVLKYSGFEQAVNLTLGLPYPRVAVDHGTALDLAGPARPTLQPAGRDAVCAAWRATYTERMNPSIPPPARVHRCRPRSAWPAFPADRAYIDKIVMAVNPQDGDRLVEIGPARARSPSRCCAASALTVIEFDRDLIAPLTAAAAPLGELTIVHRDVLRWTSPTARRRRAAAAGRQPALQHLLADPVPCTGTCRAIRDMHFMLQKEVVDRMAAGPGSKVYGRLSVMLQAYCR
jgi:hypothetical protein